MHNLEAVSLRTPPNSPPTLPPARSIQALLSAPNPDDPLADAIAKHWKDNEAEAVATGTPASLVTATPAHCPSTLSDTSQSEAPDALVVLFRALAAREWTRLYAQG